MEQFYVSCVEMSKKTSETSTLKFALLLHEVRCFTSDVPFDLQTATYIYVSDVFLILLCFFLITLSLFWHLARK